jgi:ketosteroid isomerase-like protein
MDQNKEVIIQFYQAFQKRDWKTMQTCYHSEGRFSDPVFQDLKSPEVKAMWQMLCENAKDFSLQFSEVAAEYDKGKCRWEAWYTFSKTGRPVHNIIQANFRFKDGLIIEHIDTFDFWRWSRMALGISGVFLGWTSLLRNKVQAMAQKSLGKFMQELNRSSN